MIIDVLDIMYIFKTHHLHIEIRCTWASDVRSWCCMVAFQVGRGGDTMEVHNVAETSKAIMVNDGS